MAEDGAPLSLSRVRWALNESCFTIATDHGFWVYNTDPTVLIKKQDLSGGLAIAQPLNRSNIVLLVGGGDKPFDAPNRVCIWDDIKAKVVHRIQLKKPVVNVIVKRSRLVAVVEDEVHVFDFPGKPFPKLLQVIETCPNPTGLASMASLPSSHVLATMGLHNNDVYVVDVGEKRKLGPTMCTAHKHDVSQMVLDPKGQLLATTSSRGTIVRVHETRRGELVREFRRGFTPSVLTSLRFSRDSALLCATSDRSVHVFQMQSKEAGSSSGFSFGKDRSRSYVAFDSVTACVCCFDRKARGVVAVCDSRLARKMTFDSSGKADPQHQIVQLLKYNTGSLFRVDPDKWREAHRGYVAKPPPPPQEQEQEQRQQQQSASSSSLPSHPD